MLNNVNHQLSMSSFPANNTGYFLIRWVTPTINKPALFHVTTKTGAQLSHSLLLQFLSKPIPRAFYYLTELLIDSIVITESCTSTVCLGFTTMLP